MKEVRKKERIEKKVAEQKGSKYGSKKEKKTDGG